jgi:pimeloyl-ACP methyl ester carboxylesterase
MAKWGVGRSPLDLKIFKNYPYETDWIFRQKMSAMTGHAGEVGDILYMASKIDPKDRHSWKKEWAVLAERLEEQAEASLKGGHEVSARESFLRAWNYYYAAEYGCHPSDEDFHRLWGKAVHCMQQAGALFSPAIESVEIPFEGKKLPGYFWRANNSDSSSPTLIAAGGNESSIEQILLASGPAAVERGYNFFTFDYPGHRGAVHLYPELIKRPDQEVPFKAAIDYLQTLPGVDERIALTGFSWGGYVVSRVAAYEKRLSAVIPNSPLIDYYSLFMAAWGPFLKSIPTFLIDRLVDWKMKKSPLQKSLVVYSCWTWGNENMTTTEWIDLPAIKECTVKDDLHRITCPALALIGREEGGELVNQARQFYDGISSEKKDLYMFTMEKDGTSDHCQIDNRSQGNLVMFNWLDDLFEHKARVMPVHAEGSVAR